MIQTNDDSKLETDGQRLPIEVYLGGIDPAWEAWLEWNDHLKMPLKAWDNYLKSSIKPL